MAELSLDNRREGGGEFELMSLPLLSVTMGLRAGYRATPCNLMFFFFRHIYCKDLLEWELLSSCIHKCVLTCAYNQVKI